MMDLLYTEKTITNIVKSTILPLFQSKSILLFDGPMGVGKTTIIKEILRQSGVMETVSSPTFSYVNNYKSNNHTNFYHFDLYRISGLDEFLAAGFDEYLTQPNAFIFIEWPDIISPLLNKNSLKSKVQILHLSYDETNLNQRILSL
jgi:tRNA threonylcarbamoyladenosine biosynthesis protein TsaE